jgi:hypothetical protein
MNEAFFKEGIFSRRTIATAPRFCGAAPRQCELAHRQEPFGVPMYDPSLALRKAAGIEEIGYARFPLDGNGLHFSYS